PFYQKIMKTLYTLLFCVLFGTVYSQNEIFIDFNHLLGDQSFALDTEQAQGNGMNFTFSRCEFYLSGISITHDGGQVTPIEDTWLLVRPAEQSSFSLGTHDITDVEAISWKVGVDQDMNHEDPSVLPADHPLAPQNPSMHWGWTSGYRFIAIEGLAGENVNLGWEIHALGDANYIADEILTGGVLSDGEVHIGITGAYENLIYTVSIETGVIAHAEGGSTVNRVFNNMVERVFTASDGTPASIAKANKIAFKAFPNPAANSLNLQSDHAIEEFEIYTSVGQKLSSIQSNLQSNQIDISSLPTGSYIIKVKVQGQWIVSRFIKA
ncbi:MAG: MbnP family protein, partial [Flavobacteriales bacterium]